MSNSYWESYAIRIFLDQTFFEIFTHRWPWMTSKLRFLEAHLKRFNLTVTWLLWVDIDPRWPREPHMTWKPLIFVYKRKMSESPLLFKFPSRPFASRNFEKKIRTFFTCQKTDWGCVKWASCKVVLHFKKSTRATSETRGVIIWKD